MKITGRSPTTPGGTLRLAMRVQRLSVADVAEAGRLDERLVRGILANTQPITAKAAVGFWRAFGILPSRWVRLQAEYTPPTGRIHAAYRPNTRRKRRKNPAKFPHENRKKRRNGEHYQWLTEK